MKRGPADSQIGCRPADVPVPPHQPLPDVFPLHFLPVFLECLRGHTISGPVQLEVLRGQKSPLAHDDAPFHPVLELTHVTWPTVALHGIEGIVAEAAKLLLILR